jgi:radical SAM protein with 4Fe4S-binding SPASM domain
VIFKIPFSILQPDYIEKRDQQYLFIWRELPYWMVVDEEAYEVITLADGSRSLKEIEKLLYNNDKIDREEIGELKSFVDALKDLNLLQKPNKEITYKAKSNPKPILENITINITNKCNLRCKHCYISEYNKENNFPVNSFKNFINTAKDYEYFAPNLNFAILGGEPLLEKEKLYEITKFGKNLGYEVIVSTNGQLINSEFARRAKKYNLVVQVSIEGSNEKINDYIRGNGTFLKAQRGIKELVKYGVYTIISMVVHEFNFQDIEKFYYYGRSLRVNEVRYIPLKIIGRGKLNFNPILKEDLLLVIHNLIKNHPESKQYFKRDYYTIMKTMCAYSNQTLYCGTGSKTLLVDANGDIYPCPNHYLPEFNCGNITKKSFEDIWLKSPILKEVRSTYNINKINNDCNNCIVKYWCKGGCRGEAYENSRIMTSKAIGCEDIRKSIIETFWILSKEDYTQYSKPREYF